MQNIDGPTVYQTSVIAQIFDQPNQLTIQMS